MLLLHFKTLLRQLVLPPAGPLLLGFLGLWLLARRPRAGRALLLVALVSLWLLATPVIADAITGLMQRDPPLDLQQLEGAQAIVILGGGGQRSWAPEYRGPAAGIESLERISYGAYLARRTGLPILLTGYRSEVVAMRATLRRNFDLEPRWLDDQAYDTFENARNSAVLLKRDGIERVIVVTRAVHMRRSVNEFTAAGLTVIPAPIGTRRNERLDPWDYVPSPDALLRSYEACYEMLGEPVRALLAATHLRRQTG
jgi:uncharacterized SAM-binding protein YcdF (DUF218 family)